VDRNSIRGWYDCDLAVARTFGEVTLEYRFPIISVFSGELFVDAGTDFDTQKNVPGKPGLCSTRMVPVCLLEQA
jgi:outer membrane protein insertion porin family